MTHDELVLKVHSWLRNKHDVLVSLTNQGVAQEVGWEAPTEIADAIGLAYRKTFLIECKVSRADFLADQKKKIRLNGQHGFGTHRYYACPDGLIKPDELPPKWGLLYLKGRSFWTIRQAEEWTKTPEAIARERQLLLRQVYRLRADLRGLASTNENLRWQLEHR